MQEIPHEIETIADGMLPLDMEIPGQGMIDLDSLINSNNSQNVNNSQENDLQELYQILDRASQEVLFANNIQEFTPEFLSEIEDKILSPAALNEFRQLLADNSEINTQEKIEIIKKLALFLPRQQEIAELFESQIQLSLQDEIDPVGIQCLTELLNKNMGNVVNIGHYLQQIVGLVAVSFDSEGVRDEYNDLLKLAIKEHGYILDVKDIEDVLASTSDIRGRNYVRIAGILLLSYLNQIEEGGYLNKEQMNIWEKILDKQIVGQTGPNSDHITYLMDILNHILHTHSTLQNSETEDFFKKISNKLSGEISKSAANNNKRDIAFIIAMSAIREIIFTKPPETPREQSSARDFQEKWNKYFAPIYKLIRRLPQGELSREENWETYITLDRYTTKILNNSTCLESSNFSNLNALILNRILPVAGNFSDSNSVEILYNFIASLIKKECVTLLEPIKAKISEFVKGTLIKAKKPHVIKNGLSILKAIDRASEFVRAHELLSEFALADSETSELELEEKLNELKFVAMNGVVAGEYILSETAKALLKAYDGTSSTSTINNIIELLTLLIKDKKLNSAMLQLIAEHIEQHHKEDTGTRELFRKLCDNNRRYFTSGDSISDITEETLSETDISGSGFFARDASSRVEGNNNTELDNSSSSRTDMNYWYSNDDMEFIGTESISGIQNSDASPINPEKQYKGRLTIDIIKELFNNDRVAGNESNFQEGKPLYISFNLGGKSDISSARERGESVEGSHWVAMCVIRQANCLKVLYKDSYGNALYAGQMNAIRDEFIKQGEEVGLRVEFISHNSKDQEDASACGPMTLTNLEIMAKHIESNGEQSLIDQYQSLEFSKQSNVQTIRNEHAALSSVASSVEVVNVDLEKTEQVLQKPKAKTKIKAASQSQIKDQIDDSTPATVQKDLQQIFAEFVANNAEDLTEDRLNLLKSGYEKIMEAYNNKSAILPGNSAQSRETICNWHQSTILEYAKYFKDTYLKDKQDLDPASYQYELLAVIKKANILSSGNDPRDVQILSLLLMLQNKDKGTLLQVATGEGKSTIVAMLAAFKAMNGQVVDIITSAPQLAKRDSDDSQRQQFYNMLGLKATHNNSNNTHSRPRACYKADIVYGDISSFQSDALRDREYKVRNNRPYEVVIADEVDSMLIDQRAKLVMLSNGIPGASMCSPLYCALVNKLHDVNAHIAPIDADDLSKGYRYIDGDFTKDADNKIVPIEGVDSYRVDDLNEFRSNHLKEFLNQLLAGNKLDIPRFLLENLAAPSKVDELIRNLLRSISMSLDKDYTNALNRYGKSTPTPVDANNTGIIQKNTSLKHGLQQFLQAKEGAALTSESNTTQYISNMGYFKKYMNYNTYGLTGTLGSKLESDLLRAIYEVETHDVPTFKEKQFEQYETTITNSEAEQQAAIIKAIKREIEGKGRAVLVICQTIKQAQDLYKTAKSFRSESSIKLYARSDIGGESQLPQCMFTGSLIIATNLAGRGTDIKTSKLLEAAGGLHVIIGFLPPNERVEQQAFGRTSRCGNHGSGELIIIDEQAAKVVDYPKSALNHMLSSCDQENSNNVLDNSSSSKTDMNYWYSNDDMEFIGTESLSGIQNSDASSINPEKQYKGRLTIDIIEELFHNDRVEGNESNFQEGRPLYISFNIGGKSDISSARQRGESVEGSHWVAMCVIRQDNCLKVLYKDSYGNANYTDQMNAIIDAFNNQGEEAGLEVEFISHNSKDQEDGSACGPMTLRNLEIMAKHIESNGEQSLIDQYQSLEFCKQSNVRTIRNGHASISSVDSTEGVVNSDIEKPDQMLNRLRAAVEQKTVEDAKLYDVNRITLEDRLYEAYKDLHFSLKEAENDKAKLGQLEEDWGRALKAIKKDYKDAINEQKASYQGDITTAEAAERICKVAEEKAWKEFNKFKEKKQQEYNNPADKYAMIRNPYYLVVAAINKMGDGGDSYKRAMEMLDKALGLETEYRYPMLYHKAYALIRDNAEYCAKKGKARTDNIQEVFDYLQDAKANILEYAIPNIEMVALFNIKIGDNDLFLQTQDKIKLLKLYIEHIYKVCAKLASISQGKYIDIKDIKLLKDFYDDKDRPLAEIHDLNQLGMIQIFDVKEVKPPVDYFSAIAVGVLGVIQMALGIMAVCAGQFSFGLGLFSSGVGDISKAFAIAGGAEFSWKDYVTEKAVTAAIIVVTMGVEVGLEKLGVAGFVGAPTPEKLSVALTELAIGTAAILAVDKGFSLLEQKQAKNIEKEFRDDIEKEVEKKVGNSFAKDHVKEQLALLLAIDKLNGNHDNYNAIKSLSDKAVKQKQSALQSVVGGVLSKIASKASAAGGASMASVVLKGADLSYKAFNIGDCLDKISTITKKICGNIEAQINHMAASQAAGLDLVNYLTSRMHGDITEDQAANIKAELESNNLLVNGKLQENAEEFAIEEDLDSGIIIRIQALLKEHRKINNSYEKEQEELKQIIENTIKKGISNRIIGGVLQPVVGELTQGARSLVQEKLVDLQKDVISGKTRTLKDVISGKNRILSYQESIKNKEAVMRQIAGDILQERNEQFVAELTEASNASRPQDIGQQSKINKAQAGITYAATGQEAETTQSPIGPTTLSNASLYFSTGAPNTSSGKVYNSYVSDDSASSDSLLPLYDVARQYKTGVGQYTDSRVKQKSDYPFSGGTSFANNQGSFFSRIDFSPEQNGAGIGVAATDFYGRPVTRDSVVATAGRSDSGSGAEGFWSRAGYVVKELFGVPDAYGNPVVPAAGAMEINGSKVYADSRVLQVVDLPFVSRSSSGSGAGSFFSRIDFSPEQSGAGIGISETDFYGRYLPSSSFAITRDNNSYETTQDEQKTVKIYDVKSGTKIDSNNHGLKKDSFVRNGKEVTSYRNSSGQFTKTPSPYNYSINTQIPLINLGGQEYSLVLIDSREITLGDTKVQTGMTAYTKSPHIFSGFNKGLNASMGWHSGILVGSAALGDGSNLSAHILETLGIAGFNVGKSGLGAKLGFKASLANARYSTSISETCFRYACFEGDVTLEAGIGISAKAEIGLSKSKAKVNLGGGTGIQGELSVDLSISKNKEYLAAQQKRTEQIQAKYDHFNAEIKKYSTDVISKISMMDLYDFGNHQDFESILLLAKEYSKR